MAVIAGTLGGRLRTARLAAGVSQRQVTDALGVTRGCLGHWENGRRAMSTDQVRRAARLVGVSPRWLVGLETENGPGTRVPPSLRMPRNGRPPLQSRAASGRFWRPPMPEPEGPDFEAPDYGLVDDTGRVKRA